MSSSPDTSIEGGRKPSRFDSKLALRVALVVAGSLLLVLSLVFPLILVQEEAIEATASGWSDREISSAGRLAVEARLASPACDVSVYLFSSEEWQAFNGVKAATSAQLQADPGYRRLPPDQQEMLFNESLAANLDRAGSRADLVCNHSMVRFPGWIARLVAFSHSNVSYTMQIAFLDQNPIYVTALAGGIGLPATGTALLVLYFRKRPPMVPLTGPDSH